MTTAQNPIKIIVCDCEGEYNGVAYWTGSRFHEDKSKAAVFKNEEGIVSQSEAIARVLAANAAGAWSDYKLSNVRSGFIDAKYSVLPVKKKTPVKTWWYQSLRNIITGALYNI